MTRENGDVFWLVQRQYKSWLTGKIFWKSYDSDWESSSWKRHVEWADHYRCEDDALAKLRWLMDCDHRRIIDSSVVTEVTL